MNVHCGGRVLRIATTLTITVVLLGSCQSRSLPRPVPPAIDAGSANVVANADSAVVRRALLRNIMQFQTAWRLAWQRSEVSRHGALQLSLVREDIGMGLNSPEVQRFRAIRCSAGFTSDGALVMEQTNAPTGDFRTDTRTTRTAVVERMRAGARAMDALSQQAQRTERSARDKSTVCATWTPGTDYVPLDEASDPDLALMTSLRARLRRDRDSLLTRLDIAAGRFPADTWIAAQRVRFALDQQDTMRAMLAAERCRGDAAWCGALLGVVFERRDAPLQADSAFVQALALRRARPDNDCSDSMLIFVLDDASKQRLATLPCQPRRALIDTLWWLADPLWSEPGNDRFVAHYAREAWIRLRAAATEDERFTWRSEGGGEALRATIMRYGWPSHTYWGGRFLDEEITQARERVRMEANPPYLALEYSGGRAAFMPSAVLLMRPYDSGADDWATQHAPVSSTDRWWPREHMRRRLPVVPMPAGQLAQWRRDSTVLVAIAIDAPTPERAPDPVDATIATLLASAGPGDVREIARRENPADSTLRLKGHVRAAPFILSVEIAPRVAHEPWHRLRRGVRPPTPLRQMRADEIAVSEPIIIDGSTSSDEPVTADDAVRRMLGGETVRRDRAVGVYWETYGFGSSDTLDITVQLVRDDEPGSARRIGAALGLADSRRDSVSIRWRTPDARYGSTVIVAARSTIARSVTLDLRALPRGAYIVRTTVRHADGRGAANFRRITVQ